MGEGGLAAVAGRVSEALCILACAAEKQQIVSGEMDHVRDFIRISADLYCSGQPTEEEFAEIHRAGVSVVVNLAMPDSDHALPNERAVVESFGMAYVPIPVPFSAPNIEHFLRFERELLARPSQRILVHCALNWRASFFVALFAERHLGWTRQQADDLRCALFHPDELWNALEITCRLF